jgi:hypothetical protein
MSKERIQEIIIGVLGSVSGLSAGYLFWKGITSEFLLTIVAITLIGLSFIVAFVVTSGQKRLSA